jgi:translation initiation factor eIF-2B subunit delta
METKQTREQILAERQAKKNALKQKKTGTGSVGNTVKPESKPTGENATKPDSPEKKETPVKKENISLKTKQSPTRKPIAPLKSPGSPRKTTTESPKKPDSPKKVPTSPVQSARKPIISKPATPPPPPSKDESKAVPNTIAKSETVIQKETVKLNEVTAEQNNVKTEKTKEQIKAEREAKRLAKKASKTKDGDTTTTAAVPVSAPAPTPTTKQTPPVHKCSSDLELAIKMETLHINDDGSSASETTSKKAEQKEPAVAPKADDSNKSSKPTTKAERRALQEAQRAAKQKALEEKKAVVTTQKKAEVKMVEKTPKPAPSKSVIPVDVASHKVKLFKHLYADKCSLDIHVNSNIHPAIVKLGVQYANDVIVGSNARCYAFLNALKMVINDYETPPQKDFARCLESHLQPSMAFLQKCRPFAVSMTNALRFIKWQINQLNPNDTDSDNKEYLIDAIDTYARDQIEKAAQAISISVQQKISNDDVILTYGASSLIKHILEEANRRKVSFRVIVVDSRPDNEGMEMLDSLVSQGIDCTYVLINAISFIMPEVTKVLLGAHALMANGYVMSRVGTAQIALVAKAFNVPVLVCCETHKFSERVQTDAFVHNEMGDPDMLVYNKNTNVSSVYLKDWKSNNNLTPLNLRYDITPPELVTLVVTEIALLPCTSVPVILRVKPAEIA